MTSSEESLHATITTRAELDRAFARQLVEIASSVMSKNLTYLLDQTQQHADKQEARFTEVVKAALAELRADLHADIQLQENAIHALDTKLDAAIDDMYQRVDELDARHSRERAELREHINHIEASLAGRDILVAQHLGYETRITALEQRAGDANATV